jgi:hypothetical protein
MNDELKNRLHQAEDSLNPAFGRTSQNTCSEVARLVMILCKRWKARCWHIKVNLKKGGRAQKKSTGNWSMPDQLFAPL